MYERCMHDQINESFHPLCSKLQCGFQKGFNAQHCLLVLVEKCHNVVDKRVTLGSFQMLYPRLMDTLIIK